MMRKAASSKLPPWTNAAQPYRWTLHQRTQKWGILFTCRFLLLLWLKDRSWEHLQKRLKHVPVTRSMSSHSTSELFLVSILQLMEDTGVAPTASFAGHTLFHELVMGRDTLEHLSSFDIIGKCLSYLEKNTGNIYFYHGAKHVFYMLLVHFSQEKVFLYCNEKSF